MQKIVSIYVIFAFFLIDMLGRGPIYAQEFSLPAPGAMVDLSPEFRPLVLKGIKVHPDNPFRFDFILDTGDHYPVVGPKVLLPGGEAVKTEATRLIKYFLASLTIPEKELWVNLSPYEKNRIIPQSFGLTTMGRDLLGQDYMLKQITASLLYPQALTGKKFWKRVYEEAARRLHTANIPVNTFNKVWIVPEKAVVYENAKAGTAYIVESKLKVMLEQDYLSMSKHNVETRFIASHNRDAINRVSTTNNINALGSQIIREIVIPELTKEVNQGQNFAQLRQVYNSLILAAWYKKKIKDSVLGQIYADKNKIAGVGYANSLPFEGMARKGDIELIYQQYLKAFKKGVYNYIKEEPDPLTNQVIPENIFQEE